MAFTLDNFVRSILAVDAAIGDTSLVVALAAPPLRDPPAASADAPGILILQDQPTAPTKIEIVTYTGVSIVGTQVTLSGVTRGLEGTSAQAWPAGTQIFSGSTAAVLAQFALKAALATVATSGSYNDLADQPALGTAAAKDVGVADGVAPLGSDAKISTTFLPASVIGQVSYQGSWDASAGSAPTATPSKGWYYIVTVAGSTNLGGITDWKVGDWAIYDGTQWDKVDNTDAVSSVAGLVGVISIASLQAAIGSAFATAAQGAKADAALPAVGGVSIGPFVVKADGSTNTALSFQNASGALQAQLGSPETAGRLCAQGQVGDVVLRFVATNGILRLADTAGNQSIALDSIGQFWRRPANGGSVVLQPRVFVQSVDPGAAAADGDLWFW